MRQLRVFESISIDGSFTDAHGDMSWAHAARQVAKGMNEARKYVVSKTLEPTWQNTTAIRDLVREVRALKDSDGPGIAVLGSGSIASQLGEAGLVDEYQFVVVPIALGAGRSVFSTKRALRLIDSHAFDNVNVVVTYGV
jgi:dihydrofolate reductase